MADNVSRSRRDVLKQGLIGAAAIASAVAGFGAEAQENPKPPKVKASDPLAQALQYTENASTASADLRKPDSFCHNCTFFQSTDTTGFAPCQLFQGKRVAAEGWCTSWTEK